MVEKVVSLVLMECTALGQVSWDMYCECIRWNGCHNFIKSIDIWVQWHRLDSSKMKSLALSVCIQPKWILFSLFFFFLILILMLILCPYSPWRTIAYLFLTMNDASILVHIIFPVHKADAVHTSHTRLPCESSFNWFRDNKGRRLRCFVQCWWIDRCMFAWYSSNNIFFSFVVAIFRFLFMILEILMRWQTMTVLVSLTLATPSLHLSVAHS